MSKKVLIFYSRCKHPHIQLNLELAELHKNQGDKVYLVNIFEHIKVDINDAYDYKYHILYDKKLQFKKYKKLCVEQGVELFTELKLHKKVNYKIANDISSINEIKKIVYDDTDFGMALASSIISHLNDDDPDIEKNRDKINLIASSSLTVYESFKQWFNYVKPDIVYIRNGRLAEYRPAMRFCHRNKVDLRVHDRAGTELNDAYSINSTFHHDFMYMNKVMMDHWNLSKDDIQIKVKIAVEYFENLRIGKSKHFSYVQHMEANKLPECFDINKKNIVFFSNSDTEFAAIDQEYETNTIFENQQQAVEYIAIELSSQTNVDFYVRIHPNTALSYPKEHARWIELSKRLNHKIKFIDDKSVDSYSLLLNCDIVITKYSTLGIEAVYYGKPCILIGHSRYHTLGSHYVPQSLAELKNSLLSNNLLPKDKIGAYIYGYFHRTWGIPFKYYKAIDRDSGIYRGVHFGKFEKKNKYQEIIYKVLKKLYYYKKNGVLNLLRRKIQFKPNAVS